MYNLMEEDMDINSGTIIDGLESIEENGIQIYESIIATASQEKRPRVNIMDTVMMNLIHG